MLLMQAKWMLLVALVAVGGHRQFRPVDGETPANNNRLAPAEQSANRAVKRAVAEDMTDTHSNNVYPAVKRSEEELSSGNQQNKPSGAVPDALAGEEGERKRRGADERKKKRVVLRKKAMLRRKKAGDGEDDRKKRLQFGPVVPPARYFYDAAARLKRDLLVNEDDIDDLLRAIAIAQLTQDAQQENNDILERIEEERYGAGGGGSDEVGGRSSEEVYEMAPPQRERLYLPLAAGGRIERKKKQMGNYWSPASASNYRYLPIAGQKHKKKRFDPSEGRGPSPGGGWGRFRPGAWEEEDGDDEGPYGGRSSEEQEQDENLITLSELLGRDVGGGGWR